MTAPWTISIIVPVCNARDTISGCVEALLSQTYPAQKSEVIIVDNNSTDGTQDVVSQYPVVLLHRTDKQSSYAARNLGLEYARGDIVLFTDADCLPAPGWAAALAAAFQKDTIVGAGGPVEDAEPSNDIERFIAEVQPLRNVQKLENTYFSSVITANAAYRRSIMQQVGGFDERMFTGGDIDLSWRIQNLELGEIVYAPDAVVYHKHRSSLKGMHRQFYRYGYCSGMMTALHRTDKAYPQTRAWQMRALVLQVWALVTYSGSLVVRNSVGLLQNRSPYERKKPALWMVAETGAFLGRMQALLDTRLFMRPPQGLPEKPL